MGVVNRATFETHAHKLCRQWKKESGLSNSEIADFIRENNSKSVDPSQVTRYMGDLRLQICCNKR